MNGEFPTYETTKKLTAVNTLKTGINLNNYSLNSSIYFAESTALDHYL
jgi:hypothetical protein